MSSKTKHLGLELTGDTRADNKTLFSVWRLHINGEGVGSNMELIDEAYGQMIEDIAAFDKKLKGALNREDNLILDCGSAKGYMEETVWVE